MSRLEFLFFIGSFHFNTYIFEKNLCDCDTVKACFVYSSAAGTAIKGYKTGSLLFYIFISVSGRKCRAVSEIYQKKCKENKYYRNAHQWILFMKAPRWHGKEIKIFKFLFQSKIWNVKDRPDHIPRHHVFAYPRKEKSQCSEKQCGAVSSDKMTKRYFILGAVHENCKNAVYCRQR